MALPTTPATALGAVPPPDLGRASGVQNTLQRFGAVFGVAVVTAVFAAYGHLGSPAAVLAGFRPALAVSAALSVPGALCALAVGRRQPARRQPAPGQPAPAPASTGRARAGDRRGSSAMTEPPAIGTRQEWLTARRALLGREKELSRLRDELAAQRRRLPWVPVDKPYAFDGPQGRVTLADLFEGHGQLLVYHFMLGPGWEEGCPACSFRADSFNAMPPHLAARDVSLVAVSRAAAEPIAAYRERMGWSLRWYSSAPSDFNIDFGVSFTPQQQRAGADYNYRHVDQPGDESPGLSAFARKDGQVYHTYSTYSRGLDPVSSGYQLLDLTPRGRDEDDLPWTMAWLRRRDSY